MDKYKKKQEKAVGNTSIKENRYGVSWFKKLNHGLLVALSGFGTTALAILFTFLWLPNVYQASTNIDNATINEYVQNLDINGFIGLVFIVSMVSLVVSVLIWANGIFKLIFGIGLLALIAANGIGLLWVLISGALNTFYIIIIWVTMYLLSLLLIIIFKELYIWLLIKDDEKNEFNVAKLTLLWAIIVFITTTILM